MAGPSIAQAVEAALGETVQHTARVSGGDVAEAHRVELVDGRTVFAKTRPAASPAVFETEALGLSWLSETDTIAVPDVLAVGTDTPLLVLEWIDEARPGDVRQTDADFGRQLAHLHRIGAPSFGRDDRRPTGSRGLPNEPAESWADFYATNRLLPLARLAADEGALPAATVDRLELIAGRLSEVGAADEPAARLHGDLWAGNRLVDATGRNWLIDPAAHGGHREFDLAMMRLFGGWSGAAFDAYDRVWPLADSWEDRVALHQLAPLAVHAIKFGGGYVDATVRAAELY